MDFYRKLAEDLRYEDGKLYNKQGKRVGSFKKTTGYREVSVRLNGKRKFLPEHRVIFFICNGYLPEMVDHINRIRDDNRIENLRGSDNRKNQHNIEVKAMTNIKVNSAGKYEVSFGRRNYKYLGCFSTLEEAQAVRDNHRLKQLISLDN